VKNSFTTITTTIIAVATITSVPPSPQLLPVELEPFPFEPHDDDTHRAAHPFFEPQRVVTHRLPPFEPLLVEAAAEQGQK